METIITRHPITEKVQDSRDQRTLPTISLTRAPRGEVLELVRVESGCRLGTRLAEMGLTPGSRFKLERGGRGFPLLISFQGLRMVVGHGMAQRIIVRQHPDSSS
jgi:Fe2+ transport system protein FeoA